MVAMVTGLRRVLAAMQGKRRAFLLFFHLISILQRSCHAKHLADWFCDHVRQELLRAPRTMRHGLRLICLHRLCKLVRILLRQNFLEVLRCRTFVEAARAHCVTQRGQSHRKTRLLLHRFRCKRCGGFAWLKATVVLCQRLRMHSTENFI